MTNKNPKQYPELPLIKHPKRDVWGIQRMFSLESSSIPEVYKYRVAGDTIIETPSPLTDFILDQDGNGYSMCYPDKDGFCEAVPYYTYDNVTVFGMLDQIRTLTHMVDSKRNVVWVAELMNGSEHIFTGNDDNRFFLAITSDMSKVFVDDGKHYGDMYYINPYDLNIASLTKTQVSMISWLMYQFMENFKKGTASPDVILLSGQRSFRQATVDTLLKYGLITHNRRYYDTQLTPIFFATVQALAQTKPYWEEYVKLKTRREALGTEAIVDAFIHLMRYYKYLPLFQAGFNYDEVLLYEISPAYYHGYTVYVTLGKLGVNPVYGRILIYRKDGRYIAESSKPFGVFFTGYEQYKAIPFAKIAKLLNVLDETFNETYETFGEDHHAGG